MDFKKQDASCPGANKLKAWIEKKWTAFKAKSAPPIGNTAPENILPAVKLADFLDASKAAGKTIVPLGQSWPSKAPIFNETPATKADALKPLAAAREMALPLGGRTYALYMFTPCHCPHCDVLTSIAKRN